MEPRLQYVLYFQRFSYFKRISYEKIDIFLTEEVSYSSYDFGVTKDSLYPVNFLAHFLTKWTILRLLSFKSFSQRAQIRWPIHIINPVDERKFSCNTPHQRSTTVSLETNPLYSFSWGIFGHLTYLDQLRASENIWWIINTEISQLFSDRINTFFQFNCSVLVYSKKHILTEQSV